jgi:hypothetical protein
MNYNRIYTNLIERARSRKIDQYTEGHHVIPRCVGGSNNKDNIVRLTPEEHYVAHQLLVKMYPKEHKLVYAANMMTVSAGNLSRNNKRYGWLKKKHISVCRTRTGNKNSSYGTIWVYNTELKQTKKVLELSIIEQGWKKGRILDFEKHRQKKLQEKNKLEERLNKEEKKRKNNIRLKHYRIRRSSTYRRAKAKNLYLEFTSSELSLRKFAKKKEIVPMTLSKMFSKFIKDYRVVS